MTPRLKTVTNVWNDQMPAILSGGYPLIATPKGVKGAAAFINSNNANAIDSANSFLGDP